MTEHDGPGRQPDFGAEHPDEATLVEFALGHVDEPLRDSLAGHLGSCLPCRAAYDDIASAVDGVLASAPTAQPPAGFERRVLAALDLGGQDPAPQSRLRARRRETRTWLAAAAAAAIAVAAGWVGWLIGQDDDPAPPPVAEGAVVLRTADGEQVGTAAVSMVGDDRIVVVSITQAPKDVHYRCRVVPAEGKPAVSRSWSLSGGYGGTWTFHAPEGDLLRVEMITGDGTVWSSADLT